MMGSSVQELERALLNSQSYEEWSEAAIAHDEKTGKQRWRRIDQSHRYDYISIRQRLDRLRALRARHDYLGLLFNLNEGIHGNMGGMGRADLYQFARYGTKRLIEEYVDEIVDALKLLANLEIDAISREEKRDFFLRARHCFGQSALMMSGSGTLLYFHIGVVKALWQQGLLPNILSGSSGGALVGSMLATCEDECLERIFDPRFLVQEIEEEKNRPNRPWRMRPIIIEADDVRAMIERLVPDSTFQEAFEKTGRHMNISIAPAETHQTSRLLNATTSPNVLIRDGIMASTALPGVYPAVTLAARDKYGYRKEYLPSRKWVDGAVSDDLPAKRLARLYGVNHFIVSQSNPHVIPFISDTRRSRRFNDVIRVAATRTVREWLNAGATIMHKPLARRPRLNRVINTSLSVLNQDYIGDINILPPFRFYNPARLLTHLSEKEITALVSMGEKSTWPKIEMIRIQTKISRTLSHICSDY